MNIENIALITGYIVVGLACLAFIGFLILGLYIFYDSQIKRAIGWKNRQTRQDIFYFMLHKKEIQAYLKRRNGESKKEVK